MSTNLLTALGPRPHHTQVGSGGRCSRGRAGRRRGQPCSGRRGAASCCRRPRSGGRCAGRCSWRGGRRRRRQGRFFPGAALPAGQQHPLRGVVLKQRCCISARQTAWLLSCTRTRQLYDQAVQVRDETITPSASACNQGTRAFITHQ